MLTDDALRAVQVLPGVATGDDFRSEFSVRGSDFSHLNFTVDGFATPFVMHMVRAVEERANTGLRVDDQQRLCSSRCRCRTVDRGTVGPR